MGCNVIDPGLLNKRIELHSQTMARDAYGQPIETYAIYTTVWASIEPTTMLERVRAERQESERTHRVTIRYNALVNRTDRVIYGTRTLEIVSIINPEEHNEHLVLECKEIV